MVLGKLMASGEYGAASPENDRIEDWPGELDEAAFVYTTTPHSTAKKTLYDVPYGIECNAWAPESLKKAERKDGGESVTAKNLFNEEEEAAHQDELDARRQEIRKGGKKSQEEATDRYITSYNKRHHAGGPNWRLSTRWRKRICKGKHFFELEGRFKWRGKGFKGQGKGFKWHPC